MWIRTQNRQKIVNTDQTIDIFVDRTGTLVCAEVICQRGEYGSTKITLGEYKDRDTCLKVLESILVVIGSRAPMVTMPLGGEVDAWSDAMTAIGTAYFANDFKAK